MSGHSKWSKVKHQKESTDAAKGKIFTKLSKAIHVAVHEGGGTIDPNSNFKLRLAIDKAHASNMPKENIERALLKAKGSLEGESMQEIVYEGFGPHGVGFLIACATDNKMRTVAEVKNTLERSGGVLATSGAVSHLFKSVGIIDIPKTDKPYDDVFSAVLEAGAEDLEAHDEGYYIYTDPEMLHKVKEALIKNGFALTSVELSFRPTTTIPITEERSAEQLDTLITHLEDIEDVQKVYHNADF